MIPVKKQALAFSQKLNPSKGYNLKKKTAGTNMGRSFYIWQ